MQIFVYPLLLMAPLCCCLWEHKTSIAWVIFSCFVYFDYVAFYCGLVLQSPIWCLFFLIVWNCLYSLALWSILCIAFTPPRPIDPLYGLPDDVISQLNQSDYRTTCGLLNEFVESRNLNVTVRPITMERNKTVRYCMKCQIIQPDRAWHCPQCNICSLRMDHHCFVIGLCIHLHNHKAYILFLSYSCLVALQVLATVPPCLSGLLVDVMGFTVILLIFMILQITLAVVAAIATAGLLMQQFCQFYRNKTTMEGRSQSAYPSRKYRWGSFWQHLRQLFGSNPWLWFVPINSTRLDGYTYSTIENL